MCLNRQVRCCWCCGCLSNKLCKVMEVIASSEINQRRQFSSIFQSRNSQMLHHKKKATHYLAKFPQTNVIYGFLTHNQYQMKSISDCFFTLPFSCFSISPRHNCEITIRNKRKIASLDIPINTWWQHLSSTKMETMKKQYSIKPKSVLSAPAPNSQM